MNPNRDKMNILESHARETVGNIPTSVIFLLIYLYATFIILGIIIYITHKLLLRNRRVGNPRNYNEGHMYKIYIQGSSWLNLHSSSEVWISLQSEKGTSDFYMLPSKHNITIVVNDENMQSFSIQTKECLGDLKSMTLLVRDKGFCSWQIDTIIVEDVQHEKTYDFHFFCTLEISYKPRMYVISLRKPLLPTLILKCVSAFCKYHNWISAIIHFNSVLEVSNVMHLVLIFVVFIQSLLVGLIRETTDSNGSEKMFHLRIDTFIILYLYVTTLIPDLIIHASKNRNGINKDIWMSEMVKTTKRKSKKLNISEWLESLERLNLEESEKIDKLSEENDKLSEEIDLTEGDMTSLDSIELKTLTEQRFSAISTHFTVTPADVVALDGVPNEDADDTMSWMSFYDQESPFFIISTLEKYTQFTMLFHPFKPRQLVRNRILLWINFLQKWHKVQLRAIRTYRLLYAFWWRWQELDVNMSLLRQEMNKMHNLVLEFQNTGQKIRDASIWLEPHPLWHVGIELPQDEELIVPYEPLIEHLEHTVVHVMSNFLDHYNLIQRHRKLSRDIEWFIEDWFRELLDSFLSYGYLIKSENESENASNTSSYWLPPKLSARASDKNNHLIRVVPMSQRIDEAYKRKGSFFDLKIAKTWYSWLPQLIREIGYHILEAIQKRTMNLSLIDSITYIQMQKENCSWEEACVRIMGIMADVILHDIVIYMCVFLPDATKRVMLQRTRASLADCLTESAKPWSTLVGSRIDLVENQHQYTLISILKGCVSRCKAAPLTSHDLASDDPIAQANKVRLLFLLPNDLKISDLPNEKLMQRLNLIIVGINDRANRLKRCVGLIRKQFDLTLAKRVEAKELIKQVAFAGVANTLITLIRLEMVISQVELCRDAIDLDIPVAAMTGNYNRINFREVFRLLASQYGCSRFGKRSLVHRLTVREGSTRVHNPGTIRLERRLKDFDLDIAQFLLHPWIPPLNFIVGFLMKFFLLFEIILLSAVILNMSTKLVSDSSFVSACVVMLSGALMDFTFIQPLKCFFIVLLQRYWENKGVHFVYQKNAFAC